MELAEFFRQNPRAALGFSGVVDSSYLLYAAVQAGAEPMDAADALRVGEGMDRRGRNSGGAETA